MYRQFFAALDSPALPLAAMGFFLVAFVLMLVRTFAVEAQEPTTTRSRPCRSTTPRAPTASEVKP